MSLRCLNNPSTPGLLHVSFNQDGTCLCVADLAGVKIFNVQGQDPVFSLDIGAISVAQMLFCTSLLALVGAGEQPSLTPRKLTLFNTHNSSVIQSLSFPSSVLAVLLNRKRIVAILERRAFVYNLESLELLGTLDTPPNPKGVAALTPCSEPSLLALPAATGGIGGGAAAGGAIRVYNIFQGTEALAEIPAHKSPLGLISWNHDGSMLASASQKGTVVRVHAMPSAATTHSLRRGSTTAAICSLAFTPPPLQPQLLCVASDHGTVHIFRLQAPERHRTAAAAASLLAAVLPTSVTQVVEPARPLLTLRLPGRQRVPCICAVQPPPAQPEGQQGDGGGGGGINSSREAAGASGPDSFSLAVASAGGVLYSYSVEGLAAGGNAVPKYYLQGEWRLVEPAR